MFNALSPLIFSLKMVDAFNYSRSPLRSPFHRNWIQVLRISPLPLYRKGNEERCRKNFVIPSSFAIFVDPVEFKKSLVSQNR